MRSITIAALALCLGAPAWAGEPEKAKPTPPAARAYAVAPPVTPSTATDPLAVTRVVMADLNRDIRAQLAARHAAAG